MENPLKEELKQFGLKQLELAKLLDVTPRTVSQWATGETSIPGPVRAYLRVLRKLPDLALAEEFDQLEERRMMLDEGIYELDYKLPGGEQMPGESALCVLRSGRILGSDRWGGVFQGHYEFDAGRKKNTLHVRLRVPPGGQLINGFTGGPEGSHVEISTTITRAAPIAKTIVDVAGKPIELQIRYLGALPK